MTDDKTQTTQDRHPIDLGEPCEVREHLASH